LPSLEPARLLVELGPAVVNAGFLCDDHAGVIAELAPLVREPAISESAVPKRRAEFLAGRFAARTALAALGVDSTPGRDAEGRPVWPVGVVGSITHGAGRALCAVASSRDVRGVGIDVERWMSASTKEELLARICDDSERAVLARLRTPEPASVTVAFSAKESLYKCLFPHVGRFMDFSAAAVVDARALEGRGGFSGELVLELSVDWAPSLPRGLRFTAPFVSSDRHVETGVTLRP
jgi:enterobactin synthetase component D